jgi:CRP/FNR family transcriptional regulator, cyclic AMP receptor protein
MDEKLTLLSKVPLFAGLGRKDLAEVGRLCDEVDLPSGRELMREGRRASEFFVIVDGHVRVDRGGSPVARLGPGDFLGEIALIDHGPRAATATCETECRLLVLGHREFESLLDRYPSIQLSVLKALAQRVRALEPDAAH